MNSTHETCAICISDYKQDFCQVITTCNHTFHYRCFYIYSMDKIKSTYVINCPMCQTELIDYTNDTPPHAFTVSNLLSTKFISSDDMLTVRYLTMQSVLHNRMEQKLMRLTKFLKYSDSDFDFDCNHTSVLYKEIEWKIQRRQQQLEQGKYGCQCTVS